MRPAPAYGKMTQAELVRASLACCPKVVKGPYVSPTGRR